MRVNTRTLQSGSVISTGAYFITAAGSNAPLQTSLVSDVLNASILQTGSYLNAGSGYFIAVNGRNNTFQAIPTNVALNANLLENSTLTGSSYIITSVSGNEFTKTSLQDLADALKPLLV